jgi:hypothetical protein
MQSKKIIELNGKRYDAVTGAMLGDVKPGLTRSGKNIDGFFRARTMPSKTSSVVQSKPATVVAPIVLQPAKRPGRANTVNHAKAHAPMPAKTVPARKEQSTSISVARPNGPRPVGIQANHAVAHPVQDSSTLMRKAVKRPNPSLHKQLHPTSALQHDKLSLITPKQSVANVDEARLARAQTTPRSPQVTRHGEQAAAQSLQPNIMPLAVQPVPDKPEGEVSPNPPAPKPDNKPDNIFDHALANASHFVDMQAHTKQYKKQVRRHVTSMLAGTLALAVMAGLAAYQNTPGLQFKIASVQAGVSTKMPNLKAANFAFDGVKAADGKLTVGFSGASGDYQLTQQHTNLSGNDVIKNVGATDATGAPNYTTVHAGSTTIYRLSNTNATWVSDGTWYTVTGSNLTNAQLQSLARNS